MLIKRPKVPQASFFFPQSMVLLDEHVEDIGVIKPQRKCPQECLLPFFVLAQGAVRHPQVKLILSGRWRRFQDCQCLVGMADQ